MTYEQQKQQMAKAEKLVASMEHPAALIYTEAGNVYLGLVFNEYESRGVITEKQSDSMYNHFYYKFVDYYRAA